VIIIPEAHMSAGENVIAATAADVAAAATRLKFYKHAQKWKSRPTK